MADELERIDDELADWMCAQPVFFVASAPASTEGLVNCSPKSGGSLRVIDGRTIAYLDFVGSGVETIAHVNENARIVVMLCAFEGPPKIIRVHGRGDVLAPGTREFDSLIGQFPEQPGVRSIIRVYAQRISSSCGYGVPLMDFRAPREALIKWADKRGREGLLTYQRERNSKSLDGLTGVDWLDSSVK